MQQRQHNLAKVLIQLNAVDGKGFSLFQGSLFMETNLLRQAQSQYRLAILSRIAAAVIGGYIFATGCILFLPLLLPGPKASSILEATLLSFLFYTAAIIWAFSARTISKAWIGLLVPGLFLTVISMVLAKGLL